MEGVTYLAVLLHSKLCLEVKKSGTTSLKTQWPSDGDHTFFSTRLVCYDAGKVTARVSNTILHVLQLRGGLPQRDEDEIPEALTSASVLPIGAVEIWLTAINLVSKAYLQPHTLFSSTAIHFFATF